MIEIPDALTASQLMYNGDTGRDFLAALPQLAERFLDAWGLRLDGPSMYGVCALVLPVVVRADGTPAVLKLQHVDEETAGEPVALRAWDGDGAVRLLAHDAATGTMLLERLDSGRLLASVDDTRAAVLVIAELLARLTAVPAPGGLRQLGDVAQATVRQAADALPQVADPEERRLLADCAAALRELLADADPTAEGRACAPGACGDRLLHWDLHFENVLAADREPWLAIDPKPLAGDPGYELCPALFNRFDAAEVRWRFDAMTDVMGLDRSRARVWTLARALQRCLWDVDQGRRPSFEFLEIARRLLAG